MKEFLISIFSGAIGGLFVYFYQKFDENRKSKNIIANKINSEKRTVPKDIIYSLDVGTNIEKVKDIFGNPKFSTKINETELYGEGPIFTINIYKFEDCEITIFHNDNNIQGFIIKPYIDGKFEFERFDSESTNLYLGEYIVDDSFSESSEIEYHFSMRSSWFGIVEYYGRIGNYNYYCYFGECEYYENGPKLKDLKGNVIYGYGIASNKTFFKYYE